MFVFLFSFCSPARYFLTWKPIPPNLGGVGFHPQYLGGEFARVACFTMLFEDLTPQIRGVKPIPPHLRDMSFQGNSVFEAVYSPKPCSARFRVDGTLLIRAWFEGAAAVFVVWSERDKMSRPRLFIRERELNTNYLFSNFSGAPQHIPAKSPGYPTKKVWFPWFRGTYRTFWPPTPPEDIRTKKFGFGFVFLPWFLASDCAHLETFALIFLQHQWACAANLLLHLPLSCHLQHLGARLHSSLGDAPPELFKSRYV